MDPLPFSHQSVLAAKALERGKAHLKRLLTEAELGQAMRRRQVL